MFIYNLWFQSDFMMWNIQLTEYNNFSQDF